jgi:hopanoid biosynthesis associated radical SAM protein HpnH
VYLCTNALLLKEKMHLFKPSKYFTFTVHLDGEREHHDFAVCREGVYDTAVEAMKEAIARGFRVTTNSTLFDGADPAGARRFFDDMMAMGVESMMVSPGYSYDKAPDQTHFLAKQRTRELSNRKKEWRFNATPLFFEFLMGRRDYECTPWGIPTYTPFGWQKPCYLLQDGYVDSFRELIETTKWEEYGGKSGNPRCANCMVHCGFEPSAVNHTFGSLDGLVATMKGMLSTYPDAEAAEMLKAPRPERTAQLVQIARNTAQKIEQAEAGVTR